MINIFTILRLTNREYLKNLYFCFLTISLTLKYPVRIEAAIDFNIGVPGMIKGDLN